MCGKWQLESSAVPVALQAAWPMCLYEYWSAASYIHTSASFWLMTASAAEDRRPRVGLCACCNDNWQLVDVWWFENGRFPMTVMAFGGNQPQLSTAPMTVKIGVSDRETCTPVCTPLITSEFGMNFKHSSAYAQLYRTHNSGTILCWKWPSDWCVGRTTVRSLHLCLVPRIQSRLGDRSFPAAGSRLEQRLPLSLTLTPPIDWTGQNGLKIHHSTSMTFCFGHLYSPGW